MPSLPNPSKSQVVLIGVSSYLSEDGSYEPLEDLPAVKNNLTGLQAALQDPAIWGIPDDNITIISDSDLADPMTALKTVADKIGDAAKLASDTLIIYYSGHGLVDTDEDTDRLYLALPHSNNNQVYYSALPYDWVRRALDKKLCPARRKVVILDCCYSGLALNRLQGGAAQVAARNLDIEGTYILTASASRRAALSPEGELYTGFTGELLSILEDGVSDESPTLDMEMLYIELTKRLRARQLPLPQRAETSSGSRIAIAYNRRFSGNAVAVPAMLPATASGAPASGTRRQSASGRWQDGIDARQEVTIAKFVMPENDMLLGLAMFVAPAIFGWGAIAAWAPVHAGQRAWLIAAAVLGLGSLAAFVVKPQRARYWLGGVLITAGAGWDVAWIVSGERDWVSRAWIIGLLILQLAAAFFVGVFASYADDYRVQWPVWTAKQAVLSTVKLSRWITKPLPTVDAAPLEPLTIIPATRFARTHDQELGVLAVAGDRVLLIVLSSWPATVYSQLDESHPARAALAELSRQEAQWRQLLAGSGAVLKTMILLRFTAPAGEGGAAPTEYNGITFVAADEFEDRAGAFLAADPYTLNMEILGRIQGQLAGTFAPGTAPAAVVTRAEPAIAAKVEIAIDVVGGAYDVILEEPGGKRIQVIKAIRIVAPRGLREAKDLVDNTPAPVLRGTDLQTAAKALALLESAGAKVSLRSA
jgi:ribosomal protein L7/L12